MRQSRIPAILFLFGFWGFLFPALASAAILQAPLGTKNANNSGLVGYWSFDGKDVSGATAYDRSGQGNNGAVNLFDSGVYKPGKIGQGLCPMCNRFLGLGFLDAGSPASLDNLSTKTFSAWIRPKDLNTYQGIASKGSGISGWHFWFRDWNSQASPKLQFYTVFSGGSGLWQTATNTDLLNEWVHVAISYDNTSDTNDPIFYINGIATTTVEVMTPSGTVAGDGSGTFYVGYTPVGGGSMRGSIDEARIYNRILSAAEVKALYNLGQGKMGKSGARGGGTSRKVDDPANGVSGYSSVAIGTDGFPVISHWDFTANALRFYKCDNVECSTGTASTLDDPANSVGKYTSIAIGTDGFPAISYYDATASTLKLYKCTDVACASGGTQSFSATLVDQTDFRPRMVIGSDGYPVIAYHDWAQSGSLEIYKCSSANCSSGAEQTVYNPIGDVGQYASIAIGRDGYPVIAHQGNSNKDLMLFKCDNVGCTSGTNYSLEDVANNVGNFTSIAIGSDGYPVIVHHDTDAGALRLYKCDNASCSSGTSRTLEDDTNYVGSSNSIAIGRDGFPVIVYDDATVGTLKVYKCNNVACSSGSIRTIDDQVNAVGSHNSVAIGVDGYPFISQNESTVSALRVYKCNSWDCGAATTIGKTQSNLIPTGLVSYWSFNGPDFTDKVYDRSGQNNHGYFIGGATSSAKAIGKVGQGAKFDGVDDLITAEGTSFDDLSELTVSAWIFARSSGENSAGHIMNKGTGSNGAANGWLLRLNSQNLDFSVGHSGGAANVRRFATAIPSTSYREWHHVAATWGGTTSSTSIRLYLDGVDITTEGIGWGQDGVGGRDGDAIRPLKIGNSDSFSRTFDGTIDEVRVYNRVLSASEIKQLYGAGR